MDLEPARFENGFEIRTGEGQRVNRQLPGQIAALPGTQGDPLHTLQLQDGARDAGDRIADEQEDYRLAGDGTLVAHRDRYLDAFAGFGAGPSTAEVVQRAGAVRQTVTERKLRRRRNIEVGAGEALTGLCRPPGWTLRVENRHLSHVARPRHR